MITKKTNKILWLTAIAMITIFIAFACSEKPTESANLSSSGGAGTTITPPTGGGTSSQPALKITDWAPASQFVGLTFANESLTVKIETRKNPAVSDDKAIVVWGVSTTGEEYQFHANKGAREYNITHNGRNGNALFSEDGYLKIWFNNNQSDLITLKLVNNTDGEKPETENYLIPQEYWGKYLRYEVGYYKEIYYHTNYYFIVKSDGIYNYGNEIIGGADTIISSVTYNETSIGIKFGDNNISGLDSSYIFSIYRDNELKRKIHLGHKASSGWHWYFTHENDIDKNGILIKY